MADGISWRFFEHDPARPVRNPIQGEFFASEAIAGPAEALVREGVQNARDARPRDAGGGEGTGPVRVRIFLSGHAAAVAPARMARYTPGLWPHVSAPRNGLRHAPRPDEVCRFLAFEDFGTTGLTGDVRQDWPLEGIRNAFYYFFRAEGLTDKSEGKGGSWGIGKYVFPRSSRANTILALTVRGDDRKKMLMGRAPLARAQAVSTSSSPGSAYTAYIPARRPHRSPAWRATAV